MTEEEASSPQTELEVTTMKKYLLGAVLSVALVAPAMADMSVTFQALGETMRAGVMCHSEGLLRFTDMTAADPDVHAYSRAHPAEVEQWELVGMAKFDQDVGQLGATKNCAMAETAALR
jgi:hypothetical protein